MGALHHAASIWQRLFPGWHDRQALRHYRERLARELSVLIRPPVAGPGAEIYLEIRARLVPAPSPAARGSGAAVPAGDPSGSLEASAAVFQPPWNFLVVGDPGSGKTTLMRHLALALASSNPLEASPAQDSAPPVPWPRQLGPGVWADRWRQFDLPFYLPLNRIDRQTATIETHLSRVLAEDGFADARAFLLRALQAGRCALFCDGLDEIKDAAERGQAALALQEFAARHAGCLVVVTSRPHSLSVPASRSGSRTIWDVLEAFARVELLDLTPEEVDDYARRSHGEEPGAGAGLWQALLQAGRLWPLAGNPWSLSLLAWVYRQDGRWPGSLALLHRRAAELWLARWAEEKLLAAPGFDPAALKRFLGVFALSLHQDGIRVLSREEVRERLRGILTAWPEEDRDQLLDWLVRNGVLRPEAGGGMALCHLTFQAFLVAWHCASRANFRSPLEYLRDPWWREVVLLLPGLLSDPAHLLDALRGQDVALAGLALPDPGWLDARVTGSRVFTEVTAGIVAALRGQHERGGSAGAMAADSLARVPAWGATDYLERQAREGSGPSALTALMALLRTSDPATALRRWPQAGPVLQRLHHGLGRHGPELDRMILTALSRQGFPLIHVPAGALVMGSDRAAGEGPAHRLELPDFWIGKHPVTNAQYARFVEETAYRSEGDWRAAAGATWRHPIAPGKETHPVVNVSWNDVMAFCGWAGVGLPSEAEWEKAARGPEGREYPWGQGWRPGVCNTREGKLAGTSPVGQFPASASLYGCHDLAGNVWEWTRSRQRAYPYDPHDGREDVAGDGRDRVLRGGSWRDGRQSARGTARKVYRPVSGSDDYGFRIVVRKPSQPLA